MTKWYVFKICAQIICVYVLKSTREANFYILFKVKIIWKKRWKNKMKDVRIFYLSCHFRKSFCSMYKKRSKKQNTVQKWVVPWVVSGIGVRSVEEKENKKLWYVSVRINNWWRVHKLILLSLLFWLWCIIHGWKNTKCQRKLGFLKVLCNISWMVYVWRLDLLLWLEVWTAAQFRAQV